jgi:hypothetical protein
VLEYCAKSELHPASAGLGMLKGRQITGAMIGLISDRIKQLYRPVGADLFCFDTRG